FSQRSSASGEQTPHWDGARLWHEKQQWPDWARSTSFPVIESRPDAVLSKAADRCEQRRRQRETRSVRRSAPADDRKRGILPRPTTDGRVLRGDMRRSAFGGGSGERRAAAEVEWLRETGMGRELECVRIVPQLALVR